MIIDPVPRVAAGAGFSNRIPPNVRSLDRAGAAGRGGRANTQAAEDFRSRLPKLPYVRIGQMRSRAIIEMNVLERGLLLRLQKKAL